MKATILDTKTGEKITVDGPRSWEWAENGWSCDCNRESHFGVDTSPEEGICSGAHRFLVIAAEFDGVEDYDYSIAELNEQYPKELLEKHGIVTL